jgi:hypothetical protein
MACCLGFMVGKSRAHHFDALMLPRERFIGKKKAQGLDGLGQLQMVY